MTDKKITGLSRRTLLGGLGAIGVASAGAGLGTTAFFSDEEGFTDNTIEAGAVELRMDWQQSYYTGLEGQDPEDHTTWAPMNAYPDLDGDDWQDPIYTRIQLKEDPTLVGLSANADEDAIEEAYRGQFASFEDTDGSGNNEFVGPVIDLDDVKPGDRGEITISKHVFDNPAYLWLNASGFEHTVGQMNDPKREALIERYSEELGEEFTDDDLIALAEAEAQLAKEIEATLWYDDDCDNSFDESVASCIQLVIDVTDSMSSTAFGAPDADTPKDQQLVEELTEWLNRLDTADGADAADGSIEPFNVGITTMGQTVNEAIAPTDDLSDVIGEDNGDFASSTGLLKTTYAEGGQDPPLIEAIEEGAETLGDCPEDQERTLVFITNGVQVDSSALLATASDNLRSNGGEVDRYILVGYVTPTALPGDHKFIDVPAQNDIVEAINGPADPSTNPSTSVAEEIGFTAGGEQPIFQGPLYDLLTEGADVTPDGFVDDYVVDGIAGGYPLDSDRNREGRQCYPNSDTRCIALEWHLPFEVGNEIQGDSVVFDLDFYAEQCRHNDGTYNPFADETTGSA
jgi:predicted ribosomally synthesized peptide with SipW-like signal peptide